MNTEEKAEAYLEQLAEALRGKPQPEAENFLAEVKSDLEAFIAREEEKGLSETEAGERFNEEFPPPEELAASMFPDKERRSRNNALFLLLYGLVATALLFSYLLPAYQLLPIALLLLFLAYQALFQKRLWMFAAYRRAPRKINREKTARTGGFYILLIGLLLLAAEFLALPLEPWLIPVIILLLVLSFFVYTMRQQSQ